ncbi:MIC2-associated protein M2AP [Besnoitia besnoiti]|uniref:MIC2-associated protein M2AP n=1 Tax=Besnoitia besnoiti TaxID=94643 RepID=A0A2A9MIN4_BESBE|nr:MIC2-associated protein M2AP [Besnoitia besnoiti]PFH37064.1 MIC2-associated protein M2AP [Besnoitia besnoiti]
MVKIRLFSAATCAAALLPAVVSARRASSSPGRGGVLSNEPVILAQLSKAMSLTEVDCDTVKVEGPLPEGAVVKLTASGWGAGPLQMDVGQALADQNGDKGHSSVASITCHGPDAVESDQARKCYRTKVGAEGAVEEEQVSLPITGPGSAFMFVCVSTGQAGLKCDVYGYDNAANDGWKVNSLEIPLPADAENLSFRLQATDLHTRKAYVSEDLKVNLTDPSLGCRQPPEPEKFVENEEALEI